MGKSLQDALNSLLKATKAKLKADGKQSNKVKNALTSSAPLEDSIDHKWQNDQHISPVFTEAIEGDELSFTEHMERQGFERTIFDQHKAGNRFQEKPLGKGASSINDQPRNSVKKKTKYRVDFVYPDIIKHPRADTIRHNNSGTTESLKKEIIQLNHLQSNTENRPDQKCFQMPNDQPVVKNELGYSIELDAEIIPKFEITETVNEKERYDLLGGEHEQIANGVTYDERELNIGLDFGTSSVKVVIGDTVLKKAFAVPFYKCFGLDQYLLPSRVWRDETGYSLHGMGEPKRNLKLVLTSRECDPESFKNAVAFLALVIRHARGWLFFEHRAIYQQTKILWELTLGIPSENYNKHFLVDRFKKLAAAAWILSRHSSISIPHQLVNDIAEKALVTAAEQLQEIPEIEQLEFDVVPELSAQIYGFLSSEKFDRKATNIFMIVDIGGGTIDSSIFHVEEQKQKRLSFRFYANAVEFNGVANLHAARVNWFRHAFVKAGFDIKMDSTLDKMEIPTDFLLPVPESVKDYFSGVNIKFSNPERSPDHQFYENRVIKQVLAKTLKQAAQVADRHSDFRGMPVFVCGGGSRMNFYQKIENDLLSHPNASWRAFKPRKLEVPEILQAPGVVKEDYDRLSVAFGLSFVRVGKIVRQVMPPPSTNTPLRGCPGCRAVHGCYCR